ncbi:C-type natriuretic peptide 2-like [Archocentrus centrarchus]|uniref:C-type natriuretic peptide 2-like n=1 Tax=Archocentrus centrarchus TaxID=63155 RepID=UPI0011EA4CDF|nr:C-type natriuretic peptide 2-like [Archocentrus centrarchus]XP_030580692.1 C-type natriuretic peptide 2-like [Archocentrus centrarchus]
MAAASSTFIPLVLLFLAVTVDSRPSPQRGNKQVLHTLFGSHLSTLILANPTSDDITEGSAGRPAQASSSPSGVLPVSHAPVKRLVDRKEAVPQFFLDFLRRQAKMRRRSRKSMVGGRGCFGMKMDRIGSMSGLGC